MPRIEVMNTRMLDKMRSSCALAADTLMMIGEYVQPGVTTEEIDRRIHEFMVKHGARPATLGYNGFPKSCCTSINEVICHGIPSKSVVMKDGDIVNIDVTTVLPAKGGYFGDNSAMYYVGEPSEDAKKVVEVTRRCLELAVGVVKHGARMGDIGAAIQTYAEAQGCSVVRDYVGHGIGRKFHMPPQVPHFGKAGTGRRLQRGMVFTIEPMINLGTWETELLDDDWTVVTRDGSLSAQFEHTIVVTQDGCEVLTKRKGLLTNSEDKPWADCGPLTSTLS